jgi:uncharacterized protein
VQSVTCQEILDEFGDKLRNKFRYTALQAETATDEIRSFSQLVTIAGALRLVADDPDDDKVVAQSP